ncbi:Predicted PurR-regulated permease PerM [Streptomyces sp. DvalAA-14]|uniref:AI-2E family transporter n=1 Tax=unclassified Streptomyces TaxID=2593676 RepID=UPI00081BA580|nr:MULTISPECIES: AI-2E family transporter [unclassified Streptomyces]MYS21004.1 AI-2E family transporter [Streptomyces sp. SID4948]SCD81852.1 Predicted PurR-regulated permease PerM [Streptomyces sp. DvalAA-14]
MSETPADTAPPSGAAPHLSDPPQDPAVRPVADGAAGPAADRAPRSPAGEIAPNPEIDTTPGAGAAQPAGRWVRRPLALPSTQRSSWFRIGFGLGLGAILAWLLVHTVLQISELLTLLLLAVFIAVSLEPVVAWLCRLGLRRGWSVAAVVAGFAGLLAGFLALVIPPVTAAVSALTDAVPRWRKQLHDHHSTLGRLEDHYHVIEKAQAQLGSSGASVAGGVFGAGQLVISAVTSTVIVFTVTVYVMSALPAIKRFGYRFVPGTRRPRVEQVSEEILSRVGRFMLGNIATSAIAGLATFVWCEVIGVPYPAALGFFVALMDMVPVIGSTVGGVVVSLVALAVSLPVALATAGFYIGFRIAEDYLIMPRAMKYAVNVHPVVTVVAVLAGGSLLGIIGGLVAIPTAVALGIVLDEYVFPRTDAS